MTIEEIYNLAIKMGIEADPRGQKEVEKFLKKTKEAYEKLDKDKKEEFDQEKFKNPYDDTRVLTGDPQTQIKTIMTGIDIEVGGVLLADRLSEKGDKIDLIVSHHPAGKALAALDRVVGLQADMLHNFGVPINIAEGLLAKRIAEIKRGINPLNHNEAVDAAKILKIPMMCTHTIADNLVYDYLQKELDKARPETLEEVIKLLKTIPEYKEKKGSAVLVNPKISCSPSSHLG